MSTSVHIPRPLLDAADRRARNLGVSRNRLIVRALERELAGGGDWSPSFFERLSATNAEIGHAADELLATIVAGRRSKAPRLL